MIKKFCICLILFLILMTIIPKISDKSSKLNQIFINDKIMYYIIIILLFCCVFFFYTLIGLEANCKHICSNNKCSVSCSIKFSSSKSI